MDITQTVKGIIVLQQMLDKNVKRVLDALKDKAIPLDDRWKAFIEMGEKVKMPIATYGDGFVEILDKNLTMYDDFYVDRHQTVKYVNLYNQIKNLDREIPEKNIAKWKEAVLQSGYGGFIHDW